MPKIIVVTQWKGRDYLLDRVVDARIWSTFKVSRNISSFMALECLLARLNQTEKNIFF
jgi:hypothetical protein